MKNNRLLHILKCEVTAVMVALFMLLPNSGFAEKGWQKVTNVSSLSAGDSVIIVAADYDFALSTTQQNNNRAATAITKSGDIAVITSDVQILTLEAGVSAGTFAFHTGSGYLYAAGAANATSGNNFLRTKTILDSRGSFQISIDANGQTTVIAQTTETDRTHMRFNNSNDPKIFSCYTSGSSVSNLVAIYKYVELGAIAVATPTFSIPAGIYTTPQTLAISCATAGATILYTTDNSDPAVSGLVYSAPLTISSTTTVKAIAVAGSDTSFQASATYTIPVTVANLAAFKALTDNSNPYVINNDVTFVYRNGSYTYVKDASAGLLIYGTHITTPYVEGDQISGLTGTRSVYYNQIEMTATFNTAPATSNTGAVAPIVVTMADLLANYDQYDAKLITIQGVTLDTAFNGTTNSTTAISQGSSTCDIYNRFGVDTMLAAGSVIDITAFAARHNNSIQLYPRYNSDLAAATPPVPQPSITILAPVEGAVYLTIDTLPINFDIQNFTVGTDGLLKIESYMLTQLNMPNPIFLDNAAWTALRTFGIAPPLPENWVTAVVSLVGLDSLPLAHPATDTVHFRTYKPSLPVPTITPANGTYPDSVVVTISCSNLDAAIRYTLDNSEPTETSTLYTGPFSLTTNTTVKAKAFLTNWNPSDAAAVATYTIAHEPALAVSVDTLMLYNPTGIPMGYSFDVTSAFVTTPITLTCDNSCFIFSPTSIPVGTNSANVQISYNCNNYPGFGTLTVTGDTMTRHIALIAMTKLPAPTFTPATGTSDTLINVTIACSEPSAIISYSLNGAANQVYTGPITLNTPGTYTITAMADGMYWLPSNQATATYTVTAPAPPAPVENPVISPNSGFSYNPVQVSITCPTQGADIYYTTDGTTPTTASTHYTAPFTVSTSTTVKAKAFQTGHEASGVVSATYTFPVEVANIAAFKAANTATNNTIYKITGDVTFVYENGANFYIQDATGGLLIYDVGDSISGTYNEGDVISGGICGTYTLYNGLVEMKPSRNIAASTTNTGAVAPVITDVATIISQYDNFESRLVTLQQVTFTSGVTFTNNNASNANIEQNGSTMVVRSVFKNIDMTIPAGQVADVTGFVLRYINNENTSYQIAPRGNNDIVFASTPQQDTVATPVITVNPLTNGMHSVSITCATADAEIHYTTDGTTPTAASNAYSESFIVGSGTTIKAIATKAGMVNSEVAVYTVSGIQNYDNVIELYPNPTTDKCVVRCADKVLNVAVYNVFGQLLETIPADGNTVEVSLSQFATGTYFLRVATENGVATRTVVRK